MIDKICETQNKLAAGVDDDDTRVQKLGRLIQQYREITDNDYSVVIEGLSNRETWLFDHILTLFKVPLY